MAAIARLALKGTLLAGASYLVQRSALSNQTDSKMQLGTKLILAQGAIGAAVGLAARRGIQIFGLLSPAVQIFSAVVLGIIVLRSGEASNASDEVEFKLLDKFTGPSSSNTYNQWETTGIFSISKPFESWQELASVLQPNGNPSALLVSKNMKELASELHHLIRNGSMDHQPATVDNFLNISLEQTLKYAKSTTDSGTNNYPVLAHLHHTYFEYHGEKALVTAGLKALAQAIKSVSLDGQKREIEAISNLHTLFEKASETGPNIPGVMITQVNGTSLKPECYLGALQGLMEIESLLFMQN